ncbi:MAG: hypothetical protein J1F69_00400 [Clostridiales bacterium]|nr:hypothetical protein [Clostridiales bacterium]
MRITKKQMAVITVLNIVIAGLVGLIFFLRSPRLAEGGGSGGKDVDVVATPHEKLRGPSSGKVKEISRETRLMGSGDESVVFAFSAGGVTYIFGNATVKDYDFDKIGGFLCRMGSDGTILGFTYFDGKMTAAGVVEGGFGVATVTDAGEATEKSVLYLVGDDGDSRELSELDGVAVDIKSFDSKKIVAVTAIGSGTLKLTEFTRAGNGWAAGNSTRISKGLNMQYFGCYLSRDGYIICARAYSSPRYDALALFKFQAGGDAVAYYYGGNDESMLRPYAVLPYGGGFMAVCSYGGEAAVVTVNSDMTLLNRAMLRFEFTDATLTDVNGKYYACFIDANGGVTYEIKENLSRNTIGGAFGARLSAVVNMDGPLFICTTDSAVKFTDGESVLASLDVKQADIRRVIKTGHNEMLIVLSAKGGKALSSPTGGSDVYVIAVKL